tara:strand:- start:6866 stop:7915 length:1050 start_codon:yes stop_codon:yes gene_type:complete
MDLELEGGLKMPNLKGLKGLAAKKAKAAKSAMGDGLGAAKDKAKAASSAMGDGLGAAKDKAKAATKKAVNVMGDGAKAAKTKAAAASKYMAKKASAAKEAFKNAEVFKKFNPITWIILFNLALRFLLYFSSLVGKKSQNELKRKQNLARHMRETFGIALVSFGILFYVSYYPIYYPKSDEMKKILDPILLLLYFLTLTYDYIIGFTAIIPKKYFVQTKKKQAELGGIYFGMVLGSVAFFAVLVGALYFIQTEILPDHYNMLSTTKNSTGEFTYFPIIICAAMFIFLFAVTIITFFILNADIQNKKKTYNGDNKKFYNDQFRMFYILLMISFVLLILFVDTHRDSILGQI